MNKEKKYELIPSDREGLYRVKALKDFGKVKKGDIGGYVECENNLSQYGKCWIYDNAKVLVKAQVRDNAIVCDNAVVYGNADVYGKAQVWGDARVRGIAKVCDSAQIYDNAVIQDKAKVRDNAKVWGNALIQDKAIVRGFAKVCDNAIISSNKDYIVFKNWWSSGRYFTWTRSNNMWKVGCFFGTGEELVTKAYADNVEKGIEYKKIVDYVESII